MSQGHRRSIAIGAALVVTLTIAAATPPPAAPAMLYVASRQVLPLLSQPQLGSPTTRNVASGDALTVVARVGEFTQVRTADGTDGWIRSVNLTSDAPATPSQLVAENAQLVQQVNTLDAQVRAFQDESAQLRTRLSAVEADLAVYTRKVPLTPAGVFGLIRRLAVEPWTWFGIGALLLALVLAFRWGVAHRDDSIRRRFGGLDL